MSTRYERLADHVDQLILDFANGVDVRGVSVGEHVINALGLRFDGESYAMPDSARHRWVTPWEED